MQFILHDELSQFLTEACARYEKTAPTLDKYLDNLYIRINEGGAVDLREIRFVQTLKECDQWLQPNHAANQLYHLMHSLGMDTTGHAGF